MSTNSQSRSEGEFDQKYKDEEFLNAIRNLGGYSAASRIADDVGCARRTAHDRLEELFDKKIVDSAYIGSSRLWIYPPESTQIKTHYLDNFKNYLNLNKSFNRSPEKAMVIAIHRPHSQAILDKEKDVEFRRTLIDTSEIPSIGFIYEPAPIKSIVGLFEIESVSIHSVEYLLEVGPKRSISTKESLEKYFEDKQKGTAIQIGDVRKIQPHMPLRSDEDGNWIYNPPQDYYYIDPFKFSNKLREGYLYSERPGGESHKLGDFSRTS